jgi:DinB family protein
VVREALLRGGTLTGDFEARRTELRATVERFLRSVDATPDARWKEPARPDKWSPAEIGEHLVLTYEAVLRELGGGVGMRLRLSWWRRLYVRARYLRPLLAEGRFPEPSPAVREVRPTGPVRGKAELVQVFRERARAFDEGIAAAHQKGRFRMTHPFFGRLGALDSVRLVAVHIEHHRKQLPTGEPT